MNITKEEAQQLISVLTASQEFVEASSNCKLRHGWGNQLDDAEKAITLLQSKLAEKDDVEPVAYLCAKHELDVFTHKIKPWFSYKPEGETNIPLFTHPAKQTPMTDGALEKAYEAGWVEAACWAKRKDLVADIGSPAYINDRAAHLDSLRKQTPMTDAEIRKLQAQYPTENDPMPFAQAIEKHHGIGI